MREVVFDTETTGLDPKAGDRVIEIGALELRDGFPTGETYHVYLEPEGREVHPDAERIHGITNERLQGEPTFRDEVERFEAFFGEGRLIAHNAPFDIGFLNSELGRLGRPLLAEDRVIDTLAIARKKFPGARNTLDGLCARFEIDATRRDLHGALVDTELLAQVYLELTGGRQAGLLLDEEDTGGARTGAETVTHPPQRRRQVPLPPRLTEAERAAHRAFVEELGPDSVWWKIWGEEPSAPR